jgi:hypothetical protein
VWLGDAAYTDNVRKAGCKDFKHNHHKHRCEGELDAGGPCAVQVRPDHLRSFLQGIQGKHPADHRGLRRPRLRY